MLTPDSPEPNVDELADYWTPEPIENEAVAEWFEQQPESHQSGGAR